MNIITYYILIYLLIGTGVGFILESMVRWSGEDVEKGERISLIVFWPFMVINFVYNFVKEFFK